MADYQVKVIAVKTITHNVHSFAVEKPDGFSFNPGEATDLSILKESWKDEKRPFTFTSIPENPVLEFTIKSYTDHDGVTNQLTLVKPGDIFEISDAWGAIAYKGEGVFLAGGAGVTPFIAILRALYAEGKVGNNRLFFSNKTTADIILKEEFEKMLGYNFFNIISSEQAAGYAHGRITKDFLQKHIEDFNQPFYVCGPDAFTSSVLDALQELGANPDALVFEK
ncbi:flavodoxin reductase [Dyadobacter sp. LHD-138]|uniref:flavodoxin reductase n=1 Tax=Dyadobacter sp. LHD-138 TaxID=3071413 RepID=UPI0027E085DD|nr:flavodoxin reductase [Dyadobacter sp. LHD-138]MDQ6481333.1 flavodoxin reductase [Dyadobacter sp. LHD-138]